MKLRQSVALSPSLELSRAEIESRPTTTAATSTSARAADDATQGRGGSGGAGPGGVSGGWVGTRKLLVGGWAPIGLVATALGLDSEVLLDELDGMRDGIDFKKEGVGHYVSEGGCWRLLVNLGLAKKTSAGLALVDGIEFAPIPEKAPAPVACVEAHFIKVINPLLILVDHGGELRRIRVRETRNFIRGMVVPLRELPGGGWEFGARLPRFKGKY